MDVFDWQKNPCEDIQLQFTWKDFLMESMDDQNNPCQDNTGIDKHGF